MYNQGTLHLTLVCAKLKKDHDLFTKMDPYVKISLGNQFQQTHVHHSGGKNPIWNETFAFKISNESFCELNLFDQDRGEKDDFIGKAHVDFIKLYQTKQLEEWFQVIRKGKVRGNIFVKMVFISQTMPQMPQIPQMPYPNYAPYPQMPYPNYNSYPSQPYYPYPNTNYYAPPQQQQGFQPQGFNQGYNQGYMGYPNQNGYGQNFNRPFQFNYQNQ